MELHRSNTSNSWNMRGSTITHDWISNNAVEVYLGRERKRLKRRTTTADAEREDTDSPDKNAYPLTDRSSDFWKNGDFCENYEVGVKMQTCPICLPVFSQEASNVGTSAQVVINTKITQGPVGDKDALSLSCSSEDGFQSRQRAPTPAPIETPKRVAMKGPTTHSPITSSELKYRVGLSKKERVKPLLKLARKDP